MTSPLVEETVSDRFNALPDATRKICAAVLSEHQLRDLMQERARAVAAHRAHLRAIDAHIKNVKRAIERDRAMLSALPDTGGE